MTTFQIYDTVGTIVGQNSPVKVRPKTFTECFRLLQDEKLTWVLSLF